MSKAAKRRMCPAVGREISAGECGENRGSAYVCPVSCSFNPFSPANYDQLLEIETRVDDESMRWLAEESEDLTTLNLEMKQAYATGSAELIHAFMTNEILIRRDSQGLTAAQRWDAAGLPGLKNDGRVLFRAKMKTRVALIEVQQILDRERIQVIDLLDDQPKPFILLDRSMAAQISRFATFIAWVYPMAHFSRLHGTGHSALEPISFDPVENVREMVRHLGGPSDAVEMRSWIARHFPDFARCLSGVSEARTRMVAESRGMRVPAGWGQADPGTLPARLLQNAVRDSDLGSWDALTRPVDDGGNGDPAASWAEKDRAWLERPFALLEGKTPRAAAGIPSLRPQLVRLVKFLIFHTDVRNRERGTQYEINCLPQELGLPELVFPSPPRREKPSSVRRTALDLDLDDEAEDSDEDWEVEDELLEVDMNLPLAPPIRGPLSSQEVNARMKAAMDFFRAAGSMQEILDQMEIGGSSLVTDVEDITASIFDDNAYQHVIAFLPHIWFVFVPHGTRGPVLDPERLTRYIKAEIQGISAALRKRNLPEFEAYLASGPQPAFAERIVGEMFSQISSGDEALRPNDEDGAVIAAVLRACISEMHLASSEQIEL